MKKNNRCIDYVFMPFAFLASETIDILKKVEKVMHNNKLSPRYLYIVFKIIDFVIQNRISGVTYYLFTFNSTIINKSLKFQKNKKKLKFFIT
jgi:hypothetical protein